jgi:hypothetical protein
MAARGYSVGSRSNAFQNAIDLQFKLSIIQSIGYFAQRSLLGEQLHFHSVADVWKS